MRFFILLFIAIGLSGCGFQLRGSTPPNPALQNLYIKTSAPYSEVTSNLREYLNVTGIQVAATQQDAAIVLQILSETETQVLLSVSGTAQTRQYSLILTIAFQVTDNKGIVLVPPQTLSENRTLTVMSDQILGGSNEQTMLYQQMRQAIVYDIMNRLGSREIIALLTNQKTHP